MISMRAARHAIASTTVGSICSTRSSSFQLFPDKLGASGNVAIHVKEYYQVVASLPTVEFSISNISCLHFHETNALLAPDHTSFLVPLYSNHETSSLTRLPDIFGLLTARILAPACACVRRSNAQILEVDEVPLT
jgi:hypothetical protein